MIDEKTNPIKAEQTAINQQASDFAHETDKDHGRDNGHGQDSVKIYVNDVLVPIHRGHQTGASIKAAAAAVPETGVSIADVLYSIPEYNEISDSEAVIIHGEERFKTTVPDGSSS